MKGRFWKRALALLLAVVLLTAAVPLQALASVRDLLDNSAQENQAILDQLTSITGSEEDAQRYYQLMRQYNLLDEDGHTVEEWSVTMDGEEVSVDEIRQVLAGDYDSQKMVWVDGTPVTLENLELMLEIEDYIAYLSETYFSQQEWTEEQLASFESLQQQVQESGIQIFAANDEPIIGSGGVSHSARVVVNPTPDVQNGTATFTATLTGAAEGQQVTFDWKALSGIDGLASGSGTVTLEADGDGKATASFEVTLNETLPDTVLTTVAVPYYVNLSNITNALFSTNDGNGGTAEAMTIACTAVQGGNVPDDYLNQLKPGGYFTASFSMGSYHSNEVTTENPTEADIEPVEVTVDEFSKYLIKNGLVDTLRAQSNLPANNETGQYFIDRVPQKINDDLVQWSDGDPLDLPLSPIPDTVNTMDGVDQNVWELTHLAQDPAAFYPNTPEPSVFTDDYAGAALYEPTFYLNDTYLGSKKFGAQGAKNLVLGRTPFYYTWYQIGPVYEWGDGSATFDMPMSPDTKQQLLQDGTLAITTPLYAVTTAYEGRSLYKDINKKSGTEETIKVGDETYTIWFHNGGFARLKLGQTQNSSVMDGDPFLYHHVFRKIDDIPELSRNFYHIATYGTAVYLANTNAPVVQTITAPEGEYYPGQVVPVTVTFDEPVNLGTVELKINDTTVKAAGSGYSNVATVPYTVENNQGTTVNVTSVTASDTAGNKLEAYNPGGDDGAGQLVAGVTLKPQNSAAVESLSGEATGPLNAPKATLSVKLSENENDVQWLEGNSTGTEAMDTDLIALRKVPQAGEEASENELIALKKETVETPVQGATLTAEVDIAPNDTPEEQTVVFELLLNGQVAVGKVITVTQRPFFAITDFTAEMEVVDGEGNEYVFDKPYDNAPQIYRQYDPAILLERLAVEMGENEDIFQFGYGGNGYPVLTTFQVENDKYALDEEGNMIPETEEADFAVWISADPTLATVEIETSLAEDGVTTKYEPRITPIRDGQFQVHVTALNGGLAERVDRTAFYYSGSGTNTWHDTFYVTGGLTPFFNIPNDEIRVTAGQDATVYWSSNLWDKDHNTAFEVKVTKGTGETGETVFTETYTSETTAPSRAVIPESVLRYTSGEDGDNTYTVTVTAKLGDTTQLQPVTATIVVEPSNAKVTLASLPSYYLLDGDQKSIDLAWSVDADADVKQLPFSFTVTKDGEENPVIDKTLEVQNGSKGTETLQIDKVELDTGDPNSYRDVYTVTAQVTNGDSTSLSYDSFLLYVYSKEALDIVVQNAETGVQESTAEGDTIRLNNNNVKPTDEKWSLDWQKTIVEMNRDIHLKEVISLNYGTYAWNEVADQIKWSSTNSAVASIDYKQGAVYENIENFEFTTYRPTSDFLLAGHQGGNTTVTATHNLLQQLTDSVEVQVETLKDKLYLFQCYPQGTTAGETTLTFDVYTDASRKNTDHVEIKSDGNGAAAYYAEFGIASDVTCSYQKDSIQYYGTFYQDSLESGEPDAARMGLYPCNNVQLRRAAYADLYVKKPDGTPYTGKIVFRGGVYVGEKYQENTKFRLNKTGVDDGVLNNKESGITVDLGDDGHLQIAMDITQWETSWGDAIATGDPITYIFQIEKEGGDDYYPLLVSIDATTNLDNFVDRGESVITFRNNPEQDEKHPFIALQAVTYPNYGALTNVLDSTGKVGPSDSLPVANLSTAVLWWGAEENTVDEKNASLRLVTENGIPVADVEGTEYTVSNTAYPFSNLVATQYNVTLDKDSMEGVLGKGETTGLQLEYYPDGESLSRRETLSFLLVNLLGVGKVEEAKSLSEMMTTMGSAANADAEGADKEMSTADQYVNKALQLVAGDGFSAGNLFTIQITPTSDPTKFLGFIEVNIGDLHADDSEGKGQVYANFNPGEDVQKSYAPGLTEMMFLARQKTANQYMEGYQKDFDDAAAGKGSRDIEFALGGYAESLIYYNAESGGWEVQILNGGFNAGGGMSYSWNFNTWCGPVPFTFSLTVGGSADISMDALSVAYYDTAAHTNGLGTDFLTQLRIFLYVRFFAGVGFDYSVVAFKLGVYGEVSLDMRFRWLNRPYMSGKSNIINTADGVHSNNMNGQSFQVNGEIGLEFMVTVLFISYDKILFSYRFNLLNKVTNHWETIDTYWENNQNANQAVIEDLVQNGSLSVYSSGGGASYSLNLAPTLQSKDYLAEGGRRWGKGISLFALDDTNGLARLETNTYPFANPLVTDDGELLVYISDMDDAEDVENTRIAYATKNGDSYGKGNNNSNVTVPIPSPTDSTTAEGDDASTERTDGYGDSQAALAGKKDFAVAAWTRQMGSVEKDENELGDIVLSDDDQRMMLNSADVFASVYVNNNWTTVNLSEDNPGSPDLAPVVATNGKIGNDAKAIVAWRQVVVSNGTAGEDGAQYANVTDFSQKDTIVYKIYSNGSWGEKKVLYNGTSGTVKGLQAAMLADGTAAVTYTLDTDGNGQSATDREIAYTVVGTDGQVARSVRVTTNEDLDENPQITTAKIGGTADTDERFILGWYTEKKVATQASQAAQADAGEEFETESDIRLLEFDKDGVAGKRLPDSLSQAADEDVRVTSTFRFAKNVDSIEDLSILWVEREEEQETEEPEFGENNTGTAEPPRTDNFSGVETKEWDVLQGVRLYANEGAYRFTGSMALADMEDHSVGTLIDSFDAYVSNHETNEVKAVILGTTYGEDGKTRTETAETVGGDTVQYTVPHKTSAMYTATGSYTDSIEVLGLLVDYDAVQPGATMPIQFTVKNNGIHAVDTLTVNLGSEKAGEFTSLNLLPGQSTTLSVNYTVPTEVVDVEYTITAAFGSSGATGQADTGATQGFLGLFAKTGGETAQGTVYLDLPDLSVTKAAIVKEEGGDRTIQIQLNNHSAADLEEGKHEVQLRFYSDATCETPLAAKYFDENGGEDAYIVSITDENDLELINNGGFATQVTFDAGQFVQDKSKDGEPQELPAGGVNVFIQAVVLGEPAKENEEATRSGEKVVQGEPLTTDNNGTVTAENLALRTGKEVSLTYELAQGSGNNSTDVTVTVMNNLLTKEIKGNVTAVLLGKDGNILASQQLATGEGNNFITLSGEQSAKQTLTFANTPLADVASVKLVYSEAVTPDEGEPASAELSSVELEGAVLTATSDNSYTFQWGQGGSGLLVLVAKDQNATITYNGETKIGSFPLNLTVGQTGTLTVTVTNGTGENQVTKTYTIHLKQQTEDTPGGNPGGGGGGTVTRPTYPPTVSETEDGTVTVSPTRPHQGDKVTITATPDEGYKVGEVTVTKPNGEEVAVTGQGGGKYTFTQPSGKVTIHVAFVPEDWRFTDVPADQWYFGSVKYVFEHGIMEGMSPTIFSPNSNLTRAQVVQILYNLEGKPEASKASTFTDLVEEWYKPAIAWAESTGVVQGYGDGTFRPGNAVTREEFARMMYNYAAYKGYDLTAKGDLSRFPDGDKVDLWAQPAMTWANGCGLINGHDDGTLEPKGTTTRGQAAAVLMRFHQNVAKQ